MPKIKEILTIMRRNPRGGAYASDWRCKKMLENDRYTYRVTWSEDDAEYVGLCVEFPSLSWLASEPETALQGIRQVVAEVVADLQASGEQVPEPLAVKKYSGRFMVRVPPELHRRLALEAAESGISLNRLAAEKLSRAQTNSSC
ncbi:MAG: toxin-antitoxin system HicB family antitoxin [Chloroflexota bacterium]